VKHSLLLGVVTGVLELVPLAGPIIAGVIVFLVAVSNSWILGVSVVILYVVLQHL
jgi:predicted PurR-regulated permease PerM